MPVLNLVCSTASHVTLDYYNDISERPFTGRKCTRARWLCQQPAEYRQHAQNGDMEPAVNANVVKQKDFGWDVGFNASRVTTGKHDWPSLTQGLH